MAILRWCCGGFPVRAGSQQLSWEHGADLVRRKNSIGKSMLARRAANTHRMFVGSAMKAMAGQDRINSGSLLGAHKRFLMG